MSRFSIFAAFSPLLLACSTAVEVEEAIASDDRETAAQTLERRLAADAEPVEFSDEASDGEAARDFSYSWPAQVSAIEPLAALLEQRRDNALEAQKSEWEESVTEFGTDSCITCVNRSFSQSWEVAADTSRFLVISSETFTYSGGAHGNSFFDALVWDRLADEGKGAAIDPMALFIDPVALENTAYGDYCAALFEVKAERLDLDRNRANPFENCPSVSELVVVPMSSDGQRLDRIKFLAAPYVAGSFAEGPYEFAIPVNAALMEIIQPQYRSDFALGE